MPFTPRSVRRRTERLFGDRAAARAVLTMASVLALDGADKGTVSAMAGPLGDAFGIGYAAIGLLVSVVAFVGAAFTVPFGLLTDRVRRTRLLAVTATLWGLAMIMAGAAMSYLWLLVSRAVLGAVTASSGPAVNSLVGDYFPARQRARMLGFVVGGELLGTALGFTVSGVVGSALGWRYAFWWLTLPTVALVWALLRLPEPARGEQESLRSRDPDPSERAGAHADTDAHAGPSADRCGEDATPHTDTGHGTRADGQGGDGHGTRTDGQGGDGHGTGADGQGGHGTRTDGQGGD
uniref:MFS transporter n=1 Tax=Streptomyces sp. PU-14G TaxID=2800808 RepID=UPI0034E04EB4